MNIYPFLNFNGNCSEAMHFYRACFGGELHLNYLADSACINHWPEEMKHLVVSATLTSDHIQIYASDLMNEEGIFSGNRVALFFECSHAAYLTSLFKKLSVRGAITGPVHDNMLSGEWASLTDRYGVQWIFGVKLV